MYSKIAHGLATKDEIVIPIPTACVVKSLTFTNKSYWNRSIDIKFADTYFLYKYQISGYRLFENTVIIPALDHIIHDGESITIKVSDDNSIEYLISGEIFD
jgi:hypothetical protein